MPCVCSVTQCLQQTHTDAGSGAGKTRRELTTQTSYKSSVTFISSPVKLVQMERRLTVYLCVSIESSKRHNLCPTVFLPTTTTKLGQVVPSSRSSEREAPSSDKGEPRESHCFMEIKESCVCHLLEINYLTLHGFVINTVSMPQGFLKTNTPILPVISERVDLRV